MKFEKVQEELISRFSATSIDFDADLYSVSFQSSKDISDEIFFLAGSMWQVTSVLPKYEMIQLF